MPDVRTDRAWTEHLPAHSNGPVLDDEILADPKIADAIENNNVVSLALPICNTDRAATTRVAGAIAARHGNTGFKGAVALTFIGCAGQSFGAFCLDGMNLKVRPSRRLPLCAWPGVYCASMVGRDAEVVVHRAPTWRVLLAAACSCVRPRCLLACCCMAPFECLSPDTTLLTRVALHVSHDAPSTCHPGRPRVTLAPLTAPLALVALHVACALVKGGRRRERLCR